MALSKLEFKKTDAPATPAAVPLAELTLFALIAHSCHFAPLCPAGCPMVRACACLCVSARRQA